MSKLWDQISFDLGFYEHNMRRDRPYNGKRHTVVGLRGASEIKGVTFRDLRDCFVRALFLSTGGDHDHDGFNTKPFYEEACKGENAAICENDVYKIHLDRIDPMALCANLSLEIERLMGIFPNVPKIGINPNNCDTCENRQPSDGGWCYMFRDAPVEVCRYHSERAMKDQEKGQKGHLPDTL